MATANIMAINSTVTWQKLLPALGVTVDKGVLPSTVTCPLCRRDRLTIYQDSINGGEWHHCFGCNHSGDMLELAAATWQTDLVTTISKLTLLGFDTPPGSTTQQALDLLMTRVYGRRKRVAAMWHAGQQYLAEKPASLQPLLDKFGLRFDQNGRIWLDRMGHYIGGLPNSKIIEQMQPFRTVTKETYSQTSFLHSGNAWQRMFRGSYWEDVLMVPMYTLPGLIMNWLFVGRQGREEDFVYYPINGFACRSDKQESGLAMYDVLHASMVDTFPNTVFVINDVMFALKLQSRHMRDSTIPMPIIGMFARSHIHPKRARRYEIAPMAVWSTVPQREYIFWGRKPDARLYNAAARVNGKVQIAEFMADALWNSPKRVLTRVRQTAEPWGISLERLLRDMSNEERELFLAELQLPTHARLDFMARCSEGTKELLAESERSTIVPKQVCINNHNVVETMSGWFSSKNNSLISDAILRIEKAIYEEDSDNVWYQGYIIYKGKQIPFLEPAAVIDAAPATWLRKTVLKTGAGLVNFNKAWTHNIMQIALHFNPPEAVQAVSVFGWDVNKTAFVLPRMIVHVGGHAEEQASLTLSETLPATQFSCPDMVLPDLQALTQQGNDSERNVFWATTACVMANVIAPALNEMTHGVGLCGHGAVTLGKLTARSLGCPEHHLTTKRKDIVNWLTAITGKHKWPVLLHVDKETRYYELAPWLNAIDAVNVVLAANPAIIDAMAIPTAWRLIHDETELMAGSGIAANAAMFASQWLVSFCERNLALQSTTGDLACRVLEDMAVWAEERQGDGDAIRQALSILTVEDQAEDGKAARLVSLLYHFVENGHLAVHREGYGGAKHIPLLLHIDSGYATDVVFIARKVLARLLIRHKIPAPDPAQITDVLVKAGCLMGVSHKDEAGWLVSARWWNTQIKRWQAQRHRLLKVI